MLMTGCWLPGRCCCRQLRNGHARAVADAVSHEVSHTLGLAHFGGAAGQPYDEGEGAVAPLMGRPYARPLSRWHAGQSVAGQQQDDIALISQQLPCAADDHGGSAATATPLCAGGVQAACERSQQGLTARVAGSITSSSDRDWFVLRDLVAGSSVSVSLRLPSSPFSISNLTARVRLLDAARRQLAAAASVSGAEQELVLQAVMRQPGAWLTGGASGLHGEAPQPAVPGACRRAVRGRGAKCAGRQRRLRRLVRQPRRLRPHRVCRTGQLMRRGTASKRRFCTVANALTEGSDQRIQAAKHNSQELFDRHRAAGVVSHSASSLPQQQRCARRRPASLLLHPASAAARCLRSMDNLLGQISCKLAGKSKPSALHVDTKQVRADALRNRAEQHAPLACSARD